MKKLKDVTKYLKQDKKRLDTFTGLMIKYYEDEENDEIERGTD